MLDREELARARETALHLVADKHDAVLVADLAQTAHELGHGRDEPALALHRLEDDRGDVLGADERRERPLKGGERLLGRGPAVRVRERDAVDLGRERAEPGLDVVLEVSASDRYVRPWNAPSNPITACRPV